jgi:hypothetical protein
MVLGLSLPTFTLLHVIISLVAIAAGAVTLIGMFGAKRVPAWTAWFLALTALTCITGFLFPFTKVLPSHITGVICSAVLAIAIYALYSRKLAGSWRWIYVATATMALYLNVFVLVVQAFLKVESLKGLAATQTEPPFVNAQGVVLLAFIAYGIHAARRIHPGAPQVSQAA